jgi:hypothetical protein
MGLALGLDRAETEDGKSRILKELDSVVNQLERSIAI